ncbi:hypothetical protein LBMAG42_55010 [Deltaproteobacteria bacterium]|nr:hypothetical protein LBMAG42_55010 [Deltaproteobacteria bacterium]
MAVCVPFPESGDGVPRGGPRARAPRRGDQPTSDASSLAETSASPKLYIYGYDPLRLPRGVHTLVTGPAGSGKSTAVTCIALTLALQGEPRAVAV